MFSTDLASWHINSLNILSRTGMFYNKEIFYFDENVHPTTLQRV